MTSRNEVIKTYYNKTICRKKIDTNEYECLQDKFKINFLYPFIFTANKTNEDIVDTNIPANSTIEGLALYSITYTHQQINRDNINLMITIKLKRIISLYSFIMFVVIGVYILFIQILSKYFISSIICLSNKINHMKIKDEKEKKNFLVSDKIINVNNNEMLILNGIYELQNICKIIMKIYANNNFIKRHKIELNYLLDNIKNKNIKKICDSIFGKIHFNNKLFTLAEKEFKSTIIFIEEYENKLLLDKNDVNDKLKDEIKRSTIVPYLNEFSKFENIDEYMRDIIYLNIYKQRFSYLYAMTQYNLANKIYNDNNDNSHINKKNKIKLKEKRDTYFKEAIKYFNKCKNINELLGINQIKIIYSLLMLSKCYLNLKDYKNSIMNIDEALYSYYDFSNIFNDNNSNRYNPKILIFVETNIFQNILFIISNICSSFHKPFASNWIILNIFDTSPFILSDIHYSAGINIVKFLEKNKNIINKHNNIVEYSKRYDNFKKYYIKIISRLYEKNLIVNNSKEIYSKKGDKFTKKSIINQTINESISFKGKSTIYSTKSKNIYNNKYMRLKKNITICLNENIIGKINWDEFKHIIIDFFKKYFTLNDNDKFGFIQFGKNGLITKSFLLRTLNQFISILYAIKNNIELAYDAIKKMKNSSGIYDIFESIINSYPKTEEYDNIIMFFIDEKDIKFSSVTDCLNIVETLNESNTSVFFFCFNDIIDNQKINNIQSFLNGLIE